MNLQGIQKKIPSEIFQMVFLYVLQISKFFYKLKEAPKLKVV